MKFMDGVIFGCLLLCGLGASPLAQACTTDGWSDVTGLSTTLFVGQPNSSSPNTTPRYSELCAMRLTGTGSVRDLSPDHTRLRARFYVLFSQLTNATGTAVLLRAYPNETDTSPLFEITRNNGNLVFNTTAAGGGSVNFAAPTGWVAIEFDWQSGGTMNIWVNANAATAAASTSVASGTGTISSVRLGAIAGLGGFTGALAFDAYEAHSTTAVGLLLAGDANNDVEINVFDFGTVRNEILGNSLGAGQPDCNRDGDINVFDFGCVRNIILGN